MHFSIPDTQEDIEGKGGVYISYNLHINGVFHCSVRYRQLHNLHQQICRDLGSASIPSFPPKRILNLTSSQIEERRVGLEKYILQLSQNARVLSSDIFNGWLVWAQNETQHKDAIFNDVSIDIFLMNGQKHTLKVSPTLQTNDLLKKICNQINVPASLTHHFSLFLLRKNDKDIIVVKKLQDFESPYVSQQCLKMPLRIVLRKSSWDPGVDALLMEDRVSLNLLYMQTVSEIEKGWILSSNEVLRQLAIMQANGAKKKYLEIAQTLKYYGYMQFERCMSDFPNPNTPVLISAGNKELNFRVKSEDGSFKEGNFRVTRIRCWRISSIKSDVDSIDDVSSDIPHCSSSSSKDHSTQAALELSFEYLMNPDEMRWIKVVSTQAVLISLCLQGMVHSLLGNKSPKCNRKGSLTYMKRDGSSTKVTLNHTGEPITEDTATSPIGELSWRRLSERLSDLSFPDLGRSRTNQHQIENNAFNFIGDECL